LNISSWKNSKRASPCREARSSQFARGKSAYIDVPNAQEAWLIESHIAPYVQANRFNHDPKRKRRLLLHKKQIRELWNNVRIKGMTIVPLRVYIKDGRAKIEIALAKGKKAYDKRESIARRDQARDTERATRIR
jgi:SsrA-binding protein